MQYKFRIFEMILCNFKYAKMFHRSPGTLIEKIDLFINVLAEKI